MTSILDFESPSQPLHYGSCMIYRGLLTREDVVRAVEAKLPGLPRYKQKMVQGPDSCKRWQDDPYFAPKNHVEEIVLPPGFDRSAIGREVGRVFEGQLDRSRPLWKFVLLHGLDCGNTVLVGLIHQAMVDSVSGRDLLTTLNDLTPEPEPVVATRKQPIQGAPRTDRKQQPTVESMLPSLTQSAPKTPFNGPVGGQRDYGAVELSFTEMRHIRSQVGGTVNDVVHTLLSGGLGRYLRARAVDTHELELKALWPINLRQGNERSDLCDLVSGLIVPLHVGIRDPLQCLSMKRQATAELGRSGQATTLYDPSHAGSDGPVARHWLAGPLPQKEQWVNLVSTSSPGPQIPIFLAGHELLSWYPMGPLSADLGLHVAIQSYNKKVTIGLTVDPNLVPDVWQLAEHIEEAYRDLFAATLGTQRSTETSVGFEPWTLDDSPSAPRPTSSAM